MKQKLIYVCSPYRGNTETNTQNARRYCRLVMEQGGIPFAPHLLFTQFLDEENVAERRQGLRMGMEMLKLCGALSGSCSGYAGWAFYKPKRQQEADQRRANARLRRLPMEQQRMIADKYFSGEMPWRGEGE